MKPVLALDFETKGLRLPAGMPIDEFILGYAVATEGYNNSFEWLGEVSLVHLRRLNEQYTLIFHNAGFELYILEKVLGIHVASYQDTAQMGYVYYPGVPDIRGSKHSLAAWAERAGFEKFDSGTTDWANAVWDEQMAVYCKQDALITFEVYKYLLPLLQADTTAYQFYLNVSLPFCRSVVEMETNGLHYDVERLTEFIEARKKRCGELLEEMRSIVPIAPGKKVKYSQPKENETELLYVGTEDVRDKRKSASEGDTRTMYVYKKWEPFNPNSGAQVAWALQQDGWIPTEFGESGVPSVGAEILEQLDYPLAKLLCEYAGENKLVSAFGDSILEKLDAHHRVYPSVNSTTTVTGRLSMSNPNCQQIPARGEQGAEYRACITSSSPEYKLVGCDMGGFQIKILAYFLARLVGNTALLDKMNLGIDAHTATGEVINEPRQVGKGINFSIAFGAGAKKLAETIGGSCTEEIAAGYLEKVDEFLSVSELKYVVWAICEEQGGLIHDLLGRRLVYPDIVADTRQDKARAERQVFNALIQSTEASVMQQITERVRIALIDLDAKIIVQVHDELLVEAHESCAEEVSAIMTEIFSDKRYLPLLTVVDNQAKIGNNWAEVH